jgi:hypothetical protein
MTGDRRGDGRAFLPFPLQGLVPAELREVLCDFVWDAGKLRRLPWWRHDGKPFRLLKADLLGLGNVPVQRLPAAMLPRILPEGPARVTSSGGGGRAAPARSRLPTRAT